jgi:hypothetical protein
MQTPLPPPLPETGQPKPEAGKKPRVRRQFSHIVQTVSGEKWEFTMKADGLHARRPGSRLVERADWPAVLDACLKQQRLPLV